MKHCFMLEASGQGRREHFRIEPADGENPRSTPGYRRFFLAQKRVGDIDLCHSLPDDAFPEAAYELSGKEALPDVLSIGGLGFSAELRALIEELEPGLHQFSRPVSVYLRDGRPAAKTYSIIHFRGHLDHTLIKERCTWKRTGPQMEQIQLGALQDTLVVDEDAVKGRHLWCTPDYYMQRFCSAEFAARFKAAKLKSFRFVRQRLGARESSSQEQCNV